MYLRLFTIVLAGALCAHAGSRSSFDFGWEFRYFGKGSPVIQSKVVKADSQEPENPAVHAIDGNMATRWCAKDGNAGHYLVLKPGSRKKVKTIRIIWENERSKQLSLRLDYGKKSETKNLTTQGNETRIDIGGRRIRTLKCTVNGTDKGNWASIRELVLLDMDDEPLVLPVTYAEAMPGYAAKGFRKVQLPHDWAIESEFLMDEPNETGKLPWTGYGWYRKTFSVSKKFDFAREYPII